ncbi:MAG: hypothetical protein AMS21_01510 [Gemmatimonas sp. SG8_38_2]|nr:MAG: hypothetical protein AMS21_01510 [Gemmatimonas sp. SG8_38_2]
MGRSDGTLITNIGVLRRMLPTIMPSRNGSIVYYEQQLDLTQTLPWLDAREPSITLYQLAIAGLVRVWSERPQLNRFTAGGKLYQRNEIAFSISVKKSLDENAPLTSIKAVFDPNDTIEDTCNKVDALIALGKDRERETESEKEMRLVTKLPVWVMRWLVRLQRFFDWYGLLPRFMTRNDPLYASAYVVNLGSVGLDAAYHHLYEYGNIPFFIVIGRVKKAPVVDENGELVVHDVVHIRYSFDERITDGFYTSTALERFRRYIEDPTLLEAGAP